MQLLKAILGHEEKKIEIVSLVQNEDGNYFKPF
jgi:hypothetical protein